MRAITLALVWLIVALAAVASGQDSGATASRDSTLTTKFLDTEVPPLTQFRAVRRLEATNARFKKHGWIEVVTELSPEHGFSFRVVAEGGSGYIRKKVLLPLLEGERDIVEHGGVERAALSTRNYQITSEEPLGSGLVRLALKPLREEIMLVNGAVIVTDNDADLVRIEGRLARSPSFWTRRVDIVRRYGRVGGVRVPLSVESVAHVRIAGRSELTMTYRYEMVNGQVVSEPDVVEARTDVEVP